jgi:hypothetical protein
MLFGKPEGWRPLGRPRHIWKDNTKNVKETDSEVVDWIHLDQDRDMGWALMKTV